VYTTGERRGAHSDRTKLAKKTAKEELSQTDSGKLAAELRKHAEETRMRAKPDEDAKAKPSASVSPSGVKGGRSPSKSGSAVY